MKTKFHILHFRYKGLRDYEPNICCYDKIMKLLSVPLEGLWVYAYEGVIDIRTELWGKPHLIRDPACSFFYSMPKRYCS
jgi:hypothetical protein